MHSSYWVDLLECEIGTIQTPHRTRILQAGRGQPLLLLHGSGGHIENWVRNIPVYARHFRVIAFDFRWHGYSDTGDFAPEILPQLVEHVRSVARTLGLVRYALEGQSLGGWVAALVAAGYPGEVEKLVLTTPMGYQPDPGSVEYKPQDFGPLRASSLAVLREPSWDNVRTRMERILSDPKSLPDEAIAVRHKIYNNPELNAVQQKFMEAYLGGPEPRRHEISDALLSRIAAPTLVYWADHNPVPPVVGRRMASMIPGAIFHCAQHTGHWAQFENADEHNEIVLRFLAGSEKGTLSKSALANKKTEGVLK
jgi:2-hydroxy-6-oxonona-2,4-dienedioate hydrolase